MVPKMLEGFPPVTRLEYLTLPADPVVQKFGDVIRRGRQNSPKLKEVRPTTGTSAARDIESMATFGDAWVVFRPEDVIGEEA